ncbi:MAG TPA: HAMP domain-containing protein [Polyangiaceae bacterium]|nr:HAMP domain-containing protein [Polyangiaceae bacterium]
MLLVTGIVGFSTLAIVVWTSIQESTEHLRSVQQYIEEGITSKGMVLTQNHALALRSMTLDNAFLDMQGLLAHAIEEDGDLVYGLYVNNEHEALAFGDRTTSGMASVDREAYRKLGLTEPELLVQKPRWARAHRLGQELVEVAAPVLGEKGEVVGTLRYGLSTRRMQKALAGAKQESRARLLRSSALIASLLGSTLLLGSILGRIQAVRITRPIAALTRSARELAAGNRSVHVAIASNDELAELGSSFNSMVKELDSTYRRLEEMNRTLEEKVVQRTAELADKNRDMRLVLDNVDQGFVTLSPNGIMSKERSAVVSRWFGEETRAVSFWEYLQQQAPNFGASFELGWDQLREGALPLEVCLAVLPERLSAADRTFSFRYIPFQDGANLAGVLVVIADITERLAREREDAEHQELMQAFRQLTQDRTGFELFMRESGSLVDAVCSGRLDTEQVALKRTLHTLKGNAGSMGLTFIAELCHQLEDQLAETGAMRAELVAALGARFTAITEQLASSGAIFADRFIEVSEPEYVAVLSDLFDLGPQYRSLLDRVLSWRYEPAEKPLRRLAHQARALARRLSKGEIKVEVAAECIRLSPEDFTPFFSEMIHPVRNAIDHGLESPEQREAAGKPREGSLVFRAWQEADQLTFEIADDGAGIDWDAIAAKARAKGLPSITQTDLLDALCTDGVSTRAEATSLSGRGVGMASFKQWVVAHGGRLEVRTKRGEGTTWLIHLPSKLQPQPSPSGTSMQTLSAPQQRPTLRAGHRHS